MIRTRIKSTRLTIAQAAFVVHLLTLLSLANTIYTFHRKRHYRLFESSIEVSPSTTSAHRVKVDSSPLSSSPLRFLSSMLAANSAEARAYPDATKDVWEVSVWDPTPLCLKMFCLFSPGHVLVYWLFLPTASLDPRPSTTVATTVALIALLSTQLTMLQANFSQQSKDTSLIHKEVLNEYDTKYVRPLAMPLVRDVGIQFSGSLHSSYGHHTHNDDFDSVDTYDPFIVVNRGFKTNPNPNYVDHVDPEGRNRRPATPVRNLANGTLPSFQTPAHLRDASSPLQPRTALRNPQVRASMAPNTGDGGSLGIYSHANSPLKKSASTHFVGRTGERERSVSPVKRDFSPLKRTSVPGGMNGSAAVQRWSHLQGTPARRESGRF